VATGTNAPAFTVQVPPGVYYVRVRALAAGATSGPSNEVRLVVGDSEPPSAPAHLAGVVDGTSLALSWTPTFAGGEPSVVGLIVQGPVSGVVPLGLADTFEASGVPAGTYTIQTLAANAAGLSAPSNVLTLTVPAPCTGVPGAPVGLTAERSGQVLTVSWEPPATGAAVTRYRLFVYAPGDAEEVAAVEASRSGTPGPAYGFSAVVRARRVSGALTPSWYTFTVQGENSCGWGAMSAPVTIVVP
jgi:predicted phage tail protein